jgi:hypothetical protein
MTVVMRSKVSFSTTYNTAIVGLNSTQGNDVCLSFSVLWWPVQVEALRQANPFKDS